MVPELGVFDAGPLISFYQVERLSLLRHLFVGTIVPPAVAREVAPSLGDFPGWVEIRSAPPLHALPLDPGAGERAAIALAIDTSADFIVLDDRRARMTASELELPVIGSLGLLVSAKRNALIDEGVPLMDAMISHGHFASEELYRRILVQAGEAE